jgi:hypothetical protein
VLPPRARRARTPEARSVRQRMALGHSKGRAPEASTPTCLVECLSARTYAKVSGIPSSHAKYLLESGAFSL